MIVVGDALAQLRELPAGSVHCVVTSPPYFGLRDYGTGTWDGGDPDCGHVEREIRTGLGLAEWSAEYANGGGHKAGEVNAIQFRSVCGLCGARRVDEQVGLEASPDEYVERVVVIFREVRRVLRDDGTVWLNLGDSYAATRSYQVSDGKHQSHDFGVSNATAVPTGCKPKDLLGIPWMVAFALRADGWFLRSEIVWAKPNPMPESVTDRPTQAHEKIFLLSKSPRYFYDAEAIRERDVGGDHPRSVLDRPEPSGGLMRPHTGLRVPDGRVGAGRNKRNVWTVPTRPFEEAHFATFPPKLIEPCVRAGAPVAGVVLDPFAGSGTVGVVCEWLGRDFIGIELNPEYAAMAERRIASEGRLGRAAYRPAARQDEALF